MAETTMHWKSKNKMDDDMHRYFKSTDLEAWKAASLSYPEHKTFMQELAEKSPITSNDYRYRLANIPNQVVLTKDIKPSNFRNFDELSIELLPLKFVSDRLDVLQTSMITEYSKLFEYRIQKLKSVGIPVFLNDFTPGESFYENRFSLNYSIPVQFEYQQFFMIEPWHIAINDSFDYASNKLHAFVDNYNC